MADEKKTESVLPGDQPPLNDDGTLKIDPAAQKATDANVKKAEAGEANTGVSASTNPAPLPAGEMRPSVERPSLLPDAPNATPDVSGAPSQGKVGQDLLELEQNLAWLLQHQPSGLDVARVPELRALHQRVQSERYKEKPSPDMVDSVKRALAATGIAPEAFPNNRKD